MGLLGSPIYCHDLSGNDVQNADIFHDLPTHMTYGFGLSTSIPRWPVKKSEKSVDKLKQ